MGIVCGLIQIFPNEVERLRKDPDWIFERKVVIDSYSLGKMWHCLHYLLNESADSGEPPLDLFVFAINRGDYGLKVLDPKQVQELHRGLEPLTRKTLRERLAPNRMVEMRVYQADCLQSHPESEGEFLLTVFDEFKAFVAETAKKKLGLLVEAG